MTILSKLASSLNRRDEVPNQELAKQIATKSDKQGIKELIKNLGNKSKDIQNDCIKVLYEIGELKPSLVAEYLKVAGSSFPGISATTGQMRYMRQELLSMWLKQKPLLPGFR